jgi:hypothetical protein
MSTLEHAMLTKAAQCAVAAPSVFNTQPWRWVVDDTLSLYAQHDRQLRAMDPVGRMLLASCGAALHHARTALAAAGWETEVARHVSVDNPPPDGPELLATIRLSDRVAPTRSWIALATAIDSRRTDRRPFAEELPDEAMLAIREAVEREGLRVHRVRWDQLPNLRRAARQAIAVQLADPRYRAELRRWTSRDPALGDGVPADTVVRQVARAVPVRPMNSDPEAGLPAPDGGDTHSSYLVLFGPADERRDWLRAGEALSAALLTAAVYDVSVAPMSDLVEVPLARARVRGMLAGMGHPYLVLRCGTVSQGAQTGQASRRPLAEVVEEH